MIDEDVKYEGDPACEHRWKVHGITPDDLLYRCTKCKREEWGA